MKSRPRGSVMVTGACGMLGQAMTRLLGGGAVSLTYAQLDISDCDAVGAVLNRVGPLVVINCAAATDVDRCEADHVYADAANASGPRILADACAARGIGLVHISTDFVFDGTKPGPYTEEDRPNPLSYYGRSKLQGEEAVLAFAPDLRRALIVRTSWVFGPEGPFSTNFATKVLECAGRSQKLRIADDQWGSPTYAPFLAQGTMELLAAGADGLFHLAGDGCASRLEFAQEVTAAAGLDVVIQAAKAADFPAPAPRPRQTCLDCSRAASVGVRFPPWPEGVRRYVNELLGARSGVADKKREGSSHVLTGKDLQT